MLELPIVAMLCTGLLLLALMQDSIRTRSAC
jgi:hypothetical protein